VTQLTAHDASALANRSRSVHGPVEVGRCACRDEAFEFAKATLAEEFFLEIFPRQIETELRNASNYPSVSYEVFEPLVFAFSFEFLLSSLSKDARHCEACSRVHRHCIQALPDCSGATRL
jgi:hypothetical protein